MKWLLLNGNRRLVRYLLISIFVTLSCGRLHTNRMLGMRAGTFEFQMQFLSRWILFSFQLPGCSRMANGIANRYTGAASLNAFAAKRYCTHGLCAHCSLGTRMKYERTYIARQFEVWGLSQPVSVTIESKSTTYLMCAHTRVRYARSLRRSPRCV